MKTKEDLLIDYLEDQLSSEQRVEVEKALSDSEELRIQLEELKSILHGLDEVTVFQPSDRLRNNFEQYLDSFNESNNTITSAKEITLWSKYRTIIQLAAASVILLFGIGIGMKISEDKQRLAAVEKQMQEMMAMMNDQSVSQRIRGVNVSYNLAKADNDIIRVIIKTMNEDESSNVRLHALEALEKWSDQPFVREALINALLTQKDPAFQISLINTLVEIKEKRALPYMEDLINDTETLDYVKGETQMGIFKLQSI